MSEDLGQEPSDSSQTEAAIERNSANQWLLGAFLGALIGIIGGIACSLALDRVGVDLPYLEILPGAMIMAVIQGALLGHN